MENVIDEIFNAGLLPFFVRVLISLSSILSPVLEQIKQGNASLG